MEAAAAADRVRLSQISAWEIALKVSNGKIRLNLPVARWLEECSAGLRWLDLSLPIVVDATTLPGDFHEDPADRFIVATARHHRLTLITADETILAWAAEGHVAVARLCG